MNAITEVVWQEDTDTLLETGTFQEAIFNSARFCCISTDEKGAIQVLNAGAERMLGYAAADVLGRTPAELCDPQELVARAAALSRESGMHVAPGFWALVCNASRGGEDVYAMTWLRKNGSRLPAVVSVTALRGDDDAIVGYLLIGTDDTARRHAEESLRKITAPLQAEDALHKLTASGLAEEAPYERTTPLPVAGPRKPVALVVDDDDRAAELLCRYLEAEGFEVVRSISAEDALLEAPKHPFALIALDIQLYSMNGWQFLNQLHERGMQSQVPVIIVSTRPVEEELAKSRGAAAVLQKPFRRAQVKTVLAKLGLPRAAGAFAG